MLENIGMILVFSIAILCFCCILAYYWMRTVREMPDSDVGKLRFGTKTAFVMEKFFKRVEDAKDLPKETLKEEFGSVREELK